MRHNALLISLYELGRQPFGVASAAAWLRDAGWEVGTADLAVEQLDEDAVRAADAVAVHLPMHTATRLAVALVPRLRLLNLRARLVFFGLYAPVNAALLRELGADAVLGGEFEAALVAYLSDGLAAAPVSLERLRFRVPDRSTLPGLDRYARLEVGDERRVTGYTETSRGCLHECRHCPVVPVYGGTLRVVQRDVVLADIAQQVEAGAQHITFGDPDFFNAPEHGLRVVRVMHQRFPHLTYDVTIKVEQLLRHRHRLRELRDTGCLFVTSAAETVDDAILERLDKGHTAQDLAIAVHLVRGAGLRLAPTFVPFTPWTTASGFVDVLDTVAELGLVEDVAPVQYAIRLLVPAGSRLLELPDVRRLAGPFDAQALCHPWAHPDPAVDALQRDVLAIVIHAQQHGTGRAEVLDALRQRAVVDGGGPARRAPRAEAVAGAGPRLSEPWFC
jgi:radical SAM superfamily enzyme YgiQ (UPF0313 family)